MEEYGVAGSWIKVFNVEKFKPLEHSLRIVCYSSNGKGLFVRICHLYVTYLDLETMKATIVKVTDSVRCLDAHLCVENLLMLDHANYVYVEEEEQGGNRGTVKRREEMKSTTKY
ncbi:hypothetical protein KSS87_016757 [Heliosperma pusillum]|nr:hypothetical protein KSS87_013620 [Heliosperma pusillum]KAH9619772.1 hypothetical protein KSS87_016757 [Heliosperma pusillum]